MDQTISHNYTGHGIEGHLYKEHKYTSLKDIARLVRNELKIKYPKCKISVTTEYYSGGQSLHVRFVSMPFKVYSIGYINFNISNPGSNIWSDYYMNYLYDNKYKHEWERAMYTDEYWSMKKDVINIVDAFNYDDSDGQIDYFSVNFYTHINLDWKQGFMKNEIELHKQQIEQKILNGSLPADFATWKEGNQND